MAADTHAHPTRQRVAFFLAVLVAAAGCGPGGGGAESDLDAPCNDRLGRPLKAKDLVAAFRAEGFAMHSLAKSFYCNPENLAEGPAVADVSNQRAVGEDDDVVDRQGWVTCLVDQGGHAGPYGLRIDLDVGADSPIYSGTKDQFALANVHCSHYPPEQDAERWRARALAAMNRLERQLAKG